MSQSFSRRLVLVSTFALAGVFSTLIALTALFAFSRYVASFQSEIADQISDMRAYLAVHSTNDAVVLAEATGERFFHPDLLVTVLDARTRALVRTRSGTSSRLRLSNVAIDVAPRGRVTSDPVPPGAVARVSLALATLFGLNIQRVDLGDLDLVVRANNAAVVDTVDRFAPGFVLAVLFACVAAFLLARLLTQGALRPLVAVNAALERFAAGDLTPQLVSADGRGELGALAVAYNGAIAQMASAFAERRRAESAMHQFISDAGHQLKTPLTVIRGFISVLRKGELRDAHDYDRILEKMNRQSLVMGEMIEKLILLERWERDEEMNGRAIIDVAQLVEDVVTPLAEAQPSRTMTFDIAPDISAAVDPSDFAHAVTNLVDNALKYTRGGIRVRVAQEGEQVIVQVIDEGPGMTIDELGHAFDRFYRGATRREIDGSGLGLAIAKRAVERAGGSIQARSEPSAGSQFTIVLPAYKAA